MTNALKVRTANLSPRGIYLQDPILMETDFQVGQHFNYTIDEASKTLTIFIDPANTRHTVARRQVKDQLRSVLDIRNKAVKTSFADCPTVTVTIYKDKITVQGNN